MNNNQEFEDRLMLSKEEYVEIVSSFIKLCPNTHFITQTNTYYDDDSRTLMNNHYVLRVRTIYGSFTELTLKVKGKDCDEEFTEIVNAKELKEFKKHKVFPGLVFSSKIAALGVIPLSLNKIASITTKRLEIKDGDDLVVIDENRYLDIIDYNLEVESSSREKAHKKILELCEKYKLTYKEKYLSKSRRAILAYDKKKQD